MTNGYRKDQIARLFLVSIGLCVVTGGLCLAGKPPRETSLTTVVDPEGSCTDNDTGLCPDGYGAYVNGDLGVMTVILNNGGYQFTTDYSRSSILRTVSIKLVCYGPDYCDNEFEGAAQNVPIHMAIQWALPLPSEGDPNPSIVGGMGSGFGVDGKQFTFRWGPADPIGGASPVRVTKVDGGWTIESVGDQLVRLQEWFIQGKHTLITDHGLYYFPFKLMLIEPNSGN